MALTLDFLIFKSHDSGDSEPFALASGPNKMSHNLAILAPKPARPDASAFGSLEFHELQHVTPFGVKVNAIRLPPTA